MSSRQSYDLAVCNAVLSRGNEQNLQAVNGLLMAQIRTHFETQELLGYANDIAIANHGQLSKINQTLHDLHAGQSELLYSQRESTEILSRIQKGQDRHLAQIKRERALKEVLYQIEKQLSAMNSTGDKLTRAHIAELALEVIDRNRFRTRDLSELDDKRTYDSLMDSLKGSVRNLTQDELDELVQFRTIYGAYELRLGEGPEKPRNRIKELPRWNPIDKPVVPGWDLNRLKSEAAIENKPKPPEFEQPLESFEDSPPMDRQSAEELVIAEERQKEGMEPLILKTITQDEVKKELNIRNRFSGCLWTVLFFGSLCNRGLSAIWAVSLLVYLAMLAYYRLTVGPEYWHAKEYEKLRTNEKERYEKERREIVSKEENIHKIEQLMVTPRKKEENARSSLTAAYHKDRLEWERKVKLLENWQAEVRQWEETEARRKYAFEQDLKETEQQNKATREQIKENKRLYETALQIMEASINAFLDEHPSMQEFYEKPHGYGTT